MKEQVNCYTRLEKMRLQPRAKSKISIPLCRMISLPIVRPFWKNDVLNLASHFVSCGYLEGNGVFYVSMEDNEGRTKAVTEEIVATWSENWAFVNAEFENLLQSDDDLRVFFGKMFMVWDGNHRLQAWLPIINEDHGPDRSWHFCVESIILVVNGDVASLVSSLHDVNWRNQKSHVTSNLVHKLYRVQNVGKQPLSYFEKFVSKDDLAAAEAKQKSRQRTWFSLTVDCLNGLLNQYELGEAAAQAQRRYYEKFPNPSNWTAGVVDDYIFKAVEKVRTTSKTELKKQLPCADPKHTPTFLEQVKLHYEKFDEDPEITQEKLWIFATSAMDPSMKVKWIERWNQSPALREALKFPKPGFSDSIFPEWLHKATWWAQLAVEAQRLFDDAVADLNVIVNFLPENHESLPQISDYVESIQISLWDSAFYREFNAEKECTRTTHLRSS